MVPWTIQPGQNLGHTDASHTGLCVCEKRSGVNKKPASSLV